MQVVDIGTFTNSEIQLTFEVETLYYPHVSTSTVSFNLGQYFYNRKKDLERSKVLWGNFYCDLMPCDSI